MAGRLLAFATLAFFASSLLSESLFAAALPVTVIDLDGVPFAGKLVAMTANAITLSTAGQTREFPASEIFQLRFDHKRKKNQPWGALMFLANGDRLAVRPETIDELSATASWQAFLGWKPVKIPLETLSAFILEMPEIGAGRSQALRAALNRQEKIDLVDLKNGDQASGEFLEFDAKSLRLNSSVGETQIERASIRLVTMNRELMSFPASVGTSTLISLTDGSIISATEVNLGQENIITVKAAFGAMLELPLSEVMTIRYLGGRAVFLSDLKPAKYEHQPYLDSRWELKTDRNILGEPLRLDGVEFPKGLGMHSQSFVSYDLNGEYQTFRATIGVDDAAGRAGSVIFAVDVDGKTEFRSAPQTAQHAAIELPAIPLAGATQLTLRVEFAEFGDVRDYANWCDAVLIKKP